jgi:hypothetical protein
MIVYKIGDLQGMVEKLPETYDLGTNKLSAFKRLIKRKFDDKMVKSK